MKGAARAAPWLVLYLAWTLALLPIQIVALLMSPRLAERIPLLYHRAVCRILGLAVERRGAMSAARPTLFVCNHTSYIDIEVLGAIVPGCFVAKREVAAWPLFGLLARLQRTVVERHAATPPRSASSCPSRARCSPRHARHTAAQRDVMGERLDAGDNLILFPEGTSNDGNRVLPFKSALFAVAERRVGGAALTVQPVSIAYSKLDGLPMMRHMRPYFAWYGDMELAGHLWRMLGVGAATAVVAFHPPVTLDAFGSRKALSVHCRAAIAASVSEAIHGAPPRRAAAP